jgi:Mitochondrial carrier protein
LQRALRLVVPGAVRLQIQHKPVAGGALKYKGMVGTMRTIAKEEGIGALWAGLTPGLHRCAALHLCAVSCGASAVPRFASLNAPTSARAQALCLCAQLIRA